MVFNNPGLQPDATPFNHTNWASTITVAARVVPDWQEQLNSAGTPPDSPACADPITPCGALQNITLVPYGGTDLRISEMPWA